MNKAATALKIEQLRKRAAKLLSEINEERDELLALLLECIADAMRSKEVRRAVIRAIEARHGKRGK